MWARLRAALSLGDRVLGINARNLEYVYRWNSPSAFALVDDKIETKRHLEAHDVPVPRTLAVFAGYRDTRRLGAIVEGLDGFVVKPAAGSGGKGILVVGRVEDGRLTVPTGAGPVPIELDDIREHVLQILSGLVRPTRLRERAFLEERLVPDEVLGSMSEGGIPDVRVLLARDEPVMAMLRVPTRGSGGKANLHQGALGVGVDLRTGRTVRAIRGTTPVETHPDNGRPLTGWTVPDWPRIVELSRRASEAVELDYLGVDVIVDRRRGPLVIELNARPGLNIQLANATGLRTVLPPSEGRP